MIDARYLQRRINQKLLYAKHLLSLSDDESVREAVASHLSIAYKAWLTEICNDRHHPLNVSGETAVAIAAATEKHIPAVLAECVELEKREGSWLNLILVSAAIANDIINKPPARALPGQIAVAAVEARSLASADELQQAIAAFEAFVYRYRESMQEF